MHVYTKYNNLGHYKKQPDAILNRKLEIMSVPAHNEYMCGGLSGGHYMRMCIATECKIKNMESQGT
eukprot:3816849-Ditylum_brightwellii.AAC.1